MKSRTALSDIELKLLRLLSQNGRAPTRSIANLMNVSEATVRYHIKKLEEKGIIKGYSVILDPASVQLPIFITMGVECEPASTKKVAKAIAKSPNFFLV